MDVSGKNTIFAVSNRARGVLRAVGRLTEVDANNPNDKMTAERHKQIIDAITDKAKSVVPPKSELFLFGSRARGDAHEGSDWDILILLDKDRICLADYTLYSYPFRELGWDLGQFINVVLFTKKGWQEDAASPFHENVTEEGIRIWA